jgi:four helix bundle protein
MESEAPPHDLSRRTLTFAVRVVRMVGALPKTMEAGVIGKQVLRSGTSVGANYREANRARSKAEFVAKVGDCLKELDETAYWMDLIVETGQCPATTLADLRDECHQLLAIFTAISKKAKS